MRRRLLALEALAYLVLARLAIRVVPFRWLTAFFERGPRTPELEGEARAAACREVRRAIRAVIRRRPGAIVCFPQAVAAQAMLRRRRVGTVLYCGARASCEEGLSAHVWLMDGELAVTGWPESERYTPLASYPARRAARA